MDPIAELAGALDALCSVDPAVLGDADTVVALQRCSERLAAVTTRAVAAFDAGRSWEAEGALCEEPAEGSQIDHVVPWAAGGLTTQANGRVACGFHNRERHRAPP